MKQKKGQSLPMNAIVIAAIVLVVMVVLILIYTGSMGNFVRDIQKCEHKGGECVATCTEGNIIVGDCSHSDIDNAVCCVPSAQELAERD
jgi:hypothetical protein